MFVLLFNIATAFDAVSCSLSVQPNSILQGTDATATVTCFDQFGNVTACPTGISWSSTNSAVASVSGESETGATINGISLGSSQISVTSTDYPNVTKSISPGPLSKGHCATLNHTLDLTGNQVTSASLKNFAFDDGGRVFINGNRVLADSLDEGTKKIDYGECVPSSDSLGFPDPWGTIFYNECCSSCPNRGYYVRKDSVPQDVTSLFNLNGPNTIQIDVCNGDGTQQAWGNVLFGFTRNSFTCSANVTVVNERRSCTVTLKPNVINSLEYTIAEINYEIDSFEPSASSRVYCNDYWGSDGQRLVGYKSCVNGKCGMVCGPYIVSGNETRNVSVSLRNPANDSDRVWCNTDLQISPVLSVNLDAETSFEICEKTGAKRCLDPTTTQPTATTIPYLEFKYGAPVVAQKDYELKINVHNTADAWTPTCDASATDCTSPGSYSLMQWIDGADGFEDYLTETDAYFNNGTRIALRKDGNYPEKFDSGATRNIIATVKPLKIGSPEINIVPKADNVLNESGTKKLSIFLLIDTSSSMKEGDYSPDKIVAARESAKTFVREIYTAYTNGGKNPADYVKIGLIAFETETHLKKKLTDLSSETVMDSAINSLSADGGTDMARALIMARAQFDSDSPSNYKRIIIVLSDGNPKNLDGSSRSKVYGDIPSNGYKYDDDDEAKIFAQEESGLNKAGWSSFNESARTKIYAIGLNESIPNWLKDNIPSTPETPFFIQVNPNESDYLSKLVGEYSNILRDFVLTDNPIGTQATKTIPIYSTPDTCIVEPINTTIKPSDSPITIETKCYVGVTQTVCPPIAWSISPGTAGNIGAVTSATNTFTPNGTEGIETVGANAGGTVCSNSEISVRDTPVLDAEHVQSLFYKSDCLTLVNITNLLKNTNYCAKIIMKNTGTQTWLEENSSAGSEDGKDHFRLGISNPHDSFIYGPARILMNNGEMIPRNSQREFIINFTTPSDRSAMLAIGCTEAGEFLTCPFSWRMLDEWNTWFGEEAINNLTIDMTNPSCTVNNPGIIYAEEDAIINLEYFDFSAGAPSTATVNCGDGATYANDLSCSGGTCTFTCRNYSEGTHTINATLNNATQSAICNYSEIDVLPFTADGLFIKSLKINPTTIDEGKSATIEVIIQNNFPSQKTVSTIIEIKKQTPTVEPIGTCTTASQIINANGGTATYTCTISNTGSDDITYSLLRGIYQANANPTSTTGEPITPKSEYFTVGKSEENSRVTAPDIELILIPIILLIIIGIIRIK